MGIWSMATRVIVAGRTTSLPAWSVIVRVDDASGVVVCYWAAEPELPAQAVRARAAVAKIAVSVVRRVFIASSRVLWITREILHKIRCSLQG